MPEGTPNSQTGSLIKRFNNNIDIKPSEDKTSKTLPFSNRKFLSFVNPYSNSKKIVAVDKNGDIVEIDTVTLDEKVIYNGQIPVTEALLSPAGDSVIYSFYDTGNNKRHTYLNFSAKGGSASGEKKGESIPIVGDLKSAAFSPRGDHSAYLISRDQASGTELLILKGANVIKRVLKTRLSAAIVRWPFDFISITSYDKNGYGDLFTLSEDGELTKVVSYQHSLGVRWSPSGKKLAFSSKDKANSNRLFYKELGTGEFTDLNVDADASKCIWTNNEVDLICGIANRSSLKDEFYKISTTNGSKILVSTPSINLIVKEIAASQSENYIFVLNDIDNRLYALKIK